MSRWEVRFGYFNRGVCGLVGVVWLGWGVRLKIGGVRCVVG